MIDAPPMTPPAQPSFRQVMRGYLVLPHAVPIIVVMTATAAFALLASSGWPGLSATARLLGAMFGAQIAIGAVNELADTELDALAKPDKPIPSGLITRRGAQVVAISGAILMTALSLTFGVGSFLLCALGTGVGIAYSLWFKRTIWSWVPYLIALPLLPIWVWSTLDEIPPGIFAIYPIGAAAVIAIQIAQSLPDIAADRETGVRTLAVMLGTSLARRLCWAALALAAFLAVLASPLTNHPERTWIAAIAALGAIGLNAMIWSRNARMGVLACFPCVATGAVLLGIGWTAALLGS
jgi:4-hydroxybenzoate polyprenyltransferase